ncbi:hypothetical protein L248_0862 [Schleiferilactobacillus shenzhenensis LY-73]|uniref:Uncharacterized protein n=2 Tax=Schleiferilactobacillus shenzhenensis TaxID=1231337 RepID=U4TSW3_9LACO|nr:hypothetical protein L248_0862 [Schleiferilactobacillus shenzhenensis LY-73]
MWSLHRWFSATTCDFGVQVKAADVSNHDAAQKTTPSIIKITARGAGVALFQLDGGTLKATGRLLPAGSRWRSSSTRQINGLTFYQVSTNQWVDARYAVKE